MLSRHLANRTEPVRVGIVGAGLFGSQVAYAAEAVPGLRVVAVADLDREAARSTFARAGVPDEAVETDRSPDAAERALAAGDRVVFDDGVALVEAGPDVVVEATGVPRAAARHALAAITRGVDVVNVSVEVDTVVGPVLAHLARRAGVTYSMAYGDQPAKVVELYDWARTSGFEVVAAGRSTEGLALDPHATPADALERYGWPASGVDGVDPNPTMINSFMDGTKVAVESCAVANALGLRPDVTGMYVPETTRADVPGVLCPATDGGRLDDTGVVDCLDLTDGSVTGFVVTRTQNESLAAYLDRRGSVPTAADGRYHLFYVPFHDAQETTVSVARAAVYGEPTGQVRSQETEVVAAAKRDLAPGTTVDGGGETVYGVLEDAAVAAANDHVPLELLAGATVRSTVETDDVLTSDDVALETDSLLYALRQIQESGVLP